MTCMYDSGEWQIRVIQVNSSKLLWTSADKISHNVLNDHMEQSHDFASDHLEFSALFIH